MIQLVSDKKSDSSLTLRTLGLEARGHREITVDFDDAALATEAAIFLIFIADYLETTGNQIQSGETMAYGYWLVKFEAIETDALEVWEYDDETIDFAKGASLTLRYWKDQHAICEKYGAAFEPPRPDRLTVISPGVLEGLPVYGVRYPSPSHMSGWWITTDQYDGNISNLTHEHTYHITAARPELAPYLALPYRYRFDLSAGKSVWFDEKIEADDSDESDDTDKGQPNR
ncbi:MAG: hypothetical protein ABIP75_20115 [Pyrinomonadaceae bacterium]